MNRLILIMVLKGTILGAFAQSADAQIRNNYPDRNAIIVNNSPHIELSDFVFENTFDRSTSRFTQNLRWTNTAAQPVVAFEVVVLKYDPFDRRMVGSRWTVGGQNSADWTPLQPGESNSDGTGSIGTEHVHTAIAYVRHVRLADGTIWSANEEDLISAIRRAAPHIRELGEVQPDPDPTQQEDF